MTQLRRRIAPALLAIAVVGAVLAIPTIAPVGGEPEAQASASQTMGDTPLDDVLFWADQKKQCGLTRDQLAAIMIAPTFPETGAPPTQAPSPMTLGRWDNQNSLYSFGQPATYRDAFWHAGVGMFAFDSAGAWGMTAAVSISTYSSAAQAATTMANRWCVRPGDLNYVWAPWFGCSADRCLAIYNDIYQNGQLVNVTRDGAVGRDGGMETRTCRVGTILLTCFYVDPQRAQGYRGFVNPVFGPSPITKPFYNYEWNGREYRHWMRADTGYDIDIRADLALGVNARNGLVWNVGSDLCDVTANRGNCPPTDLPLVGDWDGAGGDSIGVKRGAYFYLRNSNSPGVADISLNYGFPDDVPVIGDWDGDGVDTVGIKRGSYFYLRNSNSPGVADVSFIYGFPDDQFVVGDWDGDGIDTIGIVRGATFYIRNANTSGIADLVFNYGFPGEEVFSGDWDGDGVDTPGLKRDSEFFLRNANTPGVADLVFFYGLPSDVGITGDWDGDGDETPGIKRREYWYLRNSNSAGVADWSFNYGLP